MPAKANMAAAAVATPPLHAPACLHAVLPSPSAPAPVELASLATLQYEKPEALKRLDVLHAVILLHRALTTLDLPVSISCQIGQKRSLAAHVCAHFQNEEFY